MNPQLFFPAVFIAFAFVAYVPPVEGQTVKVFLLGGQSNMQGTRTVNFLPPPFDEPQDDVWIWQDDNTTTSWTSLRVGFAGTGSDFDRGFGPELSLGRVLADAMPDEQFAFVKHVQGGTGATMEDGWSPDRENGLGPGFIYTDFIGKTREALTALESDGLTYEVAGVFFDQGGRDTSIREPTAASVYEEKFTEFIAGVRSEFAVPMMPFVFGQLHDWGLDPDNPRKDNWAVVRQAQENVAANDPWANMVVTDDISRQDDDLHYDEAGHIDFGQRLANAYLNLIVISGDFDTDGVLSAGDVDALANAVRAMNDDNRFDVNTDGQVDFADIEHWQRFLANTCFGDANLDGEFNTNDLVGIFQAGQYEDAIDGNSTWATGDWNGDGDFGTNDLVLAFQDGGFEQGPRDSVTTVPEQSGEFLAVSAVLFLVVQCRYKSSLKKH